jgi:hypothetical protein
MNWSSDVAMDKKLQKCAADLGADAVILTGSAQTGPTAVGTMVGGYVSFTEASYSKAQGSPSNTLTDVTPLLRT